MSDRSMWKMLHVLYTLPPGQRGLSDQQLADAGIDCGPDTIDPLKTSGVVSYDAGMYALTDASRRVLGSCVVANRRWSSDDMWVDYPSAFVVMPFSEPWSDTVFKELIEPSVICSLGNFSTKLLRGDPTGITRLHGQPEIITLGTRNVRLYPIYHPAAALYTPRMLATLREDFARLPELLALGAPEQPQPMELPEPEVVAEPVRAPETRDEPSLDQLGLF